jgi:hypothetical protein
MPIAVTKNTAVSKITAYIGKNKYEFDVTDSAAQTHGIIIPANAFSVIGTYKIIFSGILLFSLILAMGYSF